MKKVIIFILFFVVLIGGVLFLLRFVIGGPEDDWICQSGQWAKHGNPSAPKPTGTCGPIIVQKAKEQLNDESLCYSPNGSNMNFATAKEKAQVGCKDGKLEDNHSCNSSTGTWWIDFTPTTPKEGCNPACVVNVDSGNSEINWRCTGAIEPSL